MCWPDAIRVAISLRVDSDPAHGERRDGLAQDWAQRLQRWNVIPYFLPNNWDDPQRLLHEWDVQAILLTGGNTPIQAAEELPPDAAPERDATEAEMIEFARRHQLPVLAVCRGAQMLNVYSGGQLQPAKQEVVHVGATHPIEGLNESVSAAMTVNSFHNWCIRPEDLADDLTAVAWAEDGSVEAFHHQEFPWLAVMWHPEREGNLPEILDTLLGDQLRGRCHWLAESPTAGGRGA